MKRTIPYKILCFCNGLVFFAPVSLLLRTSRGVTLSQFFLLQALLSVAIFVFEIPTGMFSDRIGHKKGILVSQILLLCARAIFLIAGNIGFFILEAVLEALSCCFISGTGEAYLYELCRNDSDSNSFVRENAKAGAYGTAGFIISTVAYAGLYRLVGLNGLVIATGLATIVSIVAAVCMPEVSPAAAADSPLPQKGTGFLSGITPALFGLLLLDSALCLASLVVNFLYVEKLEWAGIASEWMTPIILGYSALNLLVPSVLKHLERKRDYVLYFVFSLIAAGFFFFLSAVNSLPAVGFMILLPFLLEIMSMILFKLENEYIDSIGKEESRASLLSVMSMGNNFLEVVFLLVSAYVSSEQGNRMFLFLGVLFVVFAFLGNVILRRMRRN